MQTHGGYFNNHLPGEANAGAQIPPGRLGMMRHHAASVGQMLAGPIWIPALASPH